MKSIFFFLKDNLTINTDNGMLTAVSIWGAIRGLETFSHLIHADDDYGVCLI